MDQRPRRLEIREIREILTDLCVLDDLLGKNNGPLEKVALSVDSKRFELGYSDEVIYVAFPGAATRRPVFAESFMEGSPGVLGGGLEYGELPALMVGKNTGEELTLLEAIWSEIDKIGGVSPVVVLGYSYGGAMAVQFAAATAGVTPDAERIAKVVTVGAPATRNGEAARRYNEVFGDRTYCVANHDDPIPRIPPSELGFCHVGHQVEMEDRDDVVGVSTTGPSSNGKLGGSSGELDGGAVELTIEVLTHMIGQQLSVYGRSPELLDRDLLEKAARSPEILAALLWGLRFEQVGQRYSTIPTAHSLPEYVTRTKKILAGKAILAVPANGPSLETIASAWRKMNHAFRHFGQPPAARRAPQSR